jgi:hypothetical protein
MEVDMRHVLIVLSSQDNFDLRVAKNIIMAHEECVPNTTVTKISFIDVLKDSSILVNYDVLFFLDIHRAVIPNNLYLYPRYDKKETFIFDGTDTSVTMEVFKHYNSNTEPNDFIKNIDNVYSNSEKSETANLMVLGAERVLRDSAIKKHYLNDLDITPLIGIGINFNS